MTLHGVTLHVDEIDQNYSAATLRECLVMALKEARVHFLGEENIDVEEVTNWTLDELTDEMSALSNWSVRRQVSKS